MFAAHIPSVDHWPPALISAARSQGTIVRLGVGHRPIAWPDSPLARCVAIQSILTARYVAIDLTAAWIHGGTQHPGTKLRLSTRSGRVPALLTVRGVVYRQFKLSDADVSHVQKFAVTTPERTTFDILRSTESLTPERRGAVLWLLSHAGVDRANVLRRARLSNNPERVRVTRRLTELKSLGRVS